MAQYSVKYRVLVMESVKFSSNAGIKAAPGEEH